MISFSLTHFKTYDRQPLRECVNEGQGIWLEYVNAYIAGNYFDSLIASSIKYNNMMSEYTGIKINYKDEYEHFGKKNKYKHQQTRYITGRLFYHVLGIVFFAGSILLVLLYLLYLCLCRLCCKAGNDYDDEFENGKKDKKDN